MYICIHQTDVLYTHIYTQHGMNSLNKYTDMVVQMDLIALRECIEVDSAFQLTNSHLSLACCTAIYYTCGHFGVCVIVVLLMLVVQAGLLFIEMGCIHIYLRARREKRWRMPHI